jgi:uncharacterized protein (TIGR02147 family)
VASYSNPRDFLRDFVEWKRAGDRKFSLIYFSRRIGCSDAYLKMVLSGRRRLPVEKVAALAKSLGLSEVERQRLVTLVLHAQAKGGALRAHFANLLAGAAPASLAYRKSGLPAVFTDSLLWEIYSLVGVDGFEPEARHIARLLTRQGTSIERIERGLHALEREGVIAKDSQGRYRAKDIILRHGADVKPAYLTALGRAAEHLRHGEMTDASSFDSFCLILSEEGFARVREILEEAKLKIGAVAAAKGPRSRIAYFNANLFWASRPAGEPTSPA